MLRRMLGWVAAVSLTATLLTTTAFFGAAAPAGASTSSDEAAFVADINALRVSRGLAPLVVDSRLVGNARRWAGVMGAAGRIWHNPNLAGEGPGDWLLLGENVGVGPSERSLHNAFVASPHHLENLLDRRFQSIGIGVVQVGPLMFVAEEFMQSSKAPATPPAPPTTKKPSPPTTVDPGHKARPDGAVAPTPGPTRPAAGAQAAAVQAEQATSAATASGTERPVDTGRCPLMRTISL